MASVELTDVVIETIIRGVANAGTFTGYREPLVGFASAFDPRFDELRRVLPTHLTPQQMLRGARSLISFFLPFAPWVVEANRRDPDAVAPEWSTAYEETNALIGRITGLLTDVLAERGVRAAGAAATHNYDPITLACPWSHKSVAVLAGLGSFGLHRMVITDAGCAGRFGSLVVDADLRVSPVDIRERCLYLSSGGCRECVALCPVGALSTDGSIDKQRCHRRLLNLASRTNAKACGKCAMGLCALGAAV